MFCFNFLDKLLHFRIRGKIDVEKDSRTDIGLQWRKKRPHEEK